VSRKEAIAPADPLPRRISGEVAEALLDEAVVQIIVETARGIEERYAIEFEQLGCDGDHTHLLCTAHPKLSPGQIVSVFKRITAKAIFRGKPAMKKALWGGEFWTGGYQVATVGERGGWEVVERYVRNQGKPRRVATSTRVILIPRALGAG